MGLFFRFPQILLKDSWIASRQVAQASQKGL
jgi:hypothetical protein